MVRFVFVCLILAIITHLELKLFQLLLKIIFLNGELDEEMYMDQPTSFEAER